MAQGTLATRADFHLHGLQEDAFAPAERAVVAVDPSSDTLTLGALAPAAGTPVRVQSTGTLPAPLSAGVVYYVCSVQDSDDLVQLATTPGGAPVNILDAGEADTTVSLVVSVGSVIDAGLAATTMLWVEDMVSHGGEIAYAECPAHVRKGICEELAGNIVTTRGLMRPGFADPSIAGRAAEARRQRQRYREGQPVRGLSDGTPSMADNGAVVHEAEGELLDWMSGGAV